MNARPSSIRQRLPALRRDHAEAQTGLIAALNNREIEDLRLSARMAGGRDLRAATVWIRFDTRIGPILVAPLLVDNQLARMTNGEGAPNGIASAATLGRIEMLVAAAERIFALELHPAGLVTEPEGDLVIIRLDALDRSGTLRHRLMIATPPHVEIEPLPLPIDLPPLIGGLALRWTARIDALPIPAARLSTIGRGDCILLGVGPLVARLYLPGRNDRATATIELKKGFATLGTDPQQGNANVSDRTYMTDADGPPDTPASADWASIRVATTIEFDGNGLTAAEMATLGKGSVLPLPVAGGTLPVRVVAGGAVIADGELVAVGEGYGVLVTAVRAGDAG